MRSLKSMIKSLFNREDEEMRRLWAKLEEERDIFLINSGETGLLLKMKVVMMLMEAADKTCTFVSEDVERIIHAKADKEFDRILSQPIVRVIKDIITLEIRKTSRSETGRIEFGLEDRLQVLDNKIPTLQDVIWYLIGKPEMLAGQLGCCTEDVLRSVLKQVSELWFWEAWLEAKDEIKGMGYDSDFTIFLGEGAGNNRLLAYR